MCSVEVEYGMDCGSVIGDGVGLVVIDIGGCGMDGAMVVVGDEAMNGALSLLKRITKRQRIIPIAKRSRTQRM